MYTCEQCSKEFTKRYCLVRHQKHHCQDLPEKSPLTCEQCQQIYSNGFSLQRHLKKHHAAAQPSASNITIGHDGNVGNDSHDNHNHDQNHHNQQAQVINNVTNQIYLTRDPNFLNELIKLKGGEREALWAIKEAVYGQIKGEVKLFGEMYLGGEYLVLGRMVCLDPKTNYYKIKNRDGTWTHDPGAVHIRKLYYGNYTDAVLLLVNKFMFEPLVDINVGAQDYSQRAENNMDYVDLKRIQDRLAEVCSHRFKQESFAKELTKYYCRRVREIQNSGKTLEESLKNVMEYANNHDLS